MNSSAWLLLAMFLAVAAVDWSAVHLGNKRLEYLAKPGCMLFLIAAAFALDPADDAARTMLVVALVLCTVGDVLLMLPDRRLGSGPVTTFLAGLVAFLLGHLAYIAGFLLEGVESGGFVLGAIPVAVMVLVIGNRVVSGVRSSEHPEFAEPVMAYIGVISAMTLFAFATTDPRAIAGALLFAGSDSLIAVQRFIRERPWGRIVIIVTYHVAQALLLTSFT